MFLRNIGLILAAAFLLAGCASEAPVTYHQGELEKGKATWYSPGLRGCRTADGERYNPRDYTAAHRHVPFGSTVRVTNLLNGRSVEVRINDRGPWKRGRIIDVSGAAAEALDMKGKGIVPVEIEVLTLGWGKRA